MRLGLGQEKQLFWMSNSNVQIDFLIFLLSIRGFQVAAMLAEGCSGAATWYTSMDPTQTSGALRHPHHHHSWGRVQVLQQSAVNADRDSCVTACVRGTAQV